MWNEEEKQKIKKFLEWNSPLVWVFHPFKMLFYLICIIAVGLLIVFIGWQLIFGTQNDNTLEQHQTPSQTEIIIE